MDLELQSLSDIGDEILGALKAAGIADQIRAYAGGYQLFIVHLAVGGPASQGGVCRGPYLLAAAGAAVPPGSGFLRTPKPA